MANVKTYDPQKLTVIVGSQICTGFEKGSFVEFDFDEDHFTKKSGVDGTTTRTKNGNFTGKLKLTMQQGASENSYFSGLAALDRTSGAGVVPIMIRDLNGDTVISSMAAWVQKTPKASFSDGEPTAREWVFDTTKAFVFLGGLS